jgi:hypothetical protein
MKMADWADKLDAFLHFNEYEVLNNTWMISHEVALKLTEEQYEQFRMMQDRRFESDFERATKKILAKNPSGKRKL